MQKKLLFTLVAGCFAASLAQAQIPAPAPEASPHAHSAAKAHGPASKDVAAKHFSRLDKNQDGVISREEASAYQHLAAHFDKIDANGDGKLSKQELQQWGQDMRAQMGQRFDEEFKAADTNGDGMLSKEEVAASKMPGLAAHFDKLDRNGDGKLSKEELKAGHKAMHSRYKHKLHSAHGKGHGHVRMDHFKAADHNGDGVVTKAEALSYASALFDKLDRDGDGKLTRAEVGQERTDRQTSRSPGKSQNEKSAKRLYTTPDNQEKNLKQQ